MTPRLLIVANRLPITVTTLEGSVEIQRSSGGLATGLLRPHEQSGGLWIGWPGTSAELDGAQREALDARLAEMRLVPVELSADQVRRYYEGFSNGVLWPLFHYLVDQLPLHVRDWDVYEQVNERFAEVVAEHHRPGDLVWVHDYQLLLVPALLRKRVPDARIGFFLHIPFPSEEIFRTLPARERILQGLLGADLVGFHTAAYLRHFASSLTHVLGVGVEIDRVRWAGREVRLGVFPMGIDAEAFAAMSADPAVEAEVRAMQGDRTVKALVGIDRLDYTKGIPRRLLAYEAMLEAHPELRERVRLVQVAVPSRTGVEAYQDFRNLVDGLIGRIQGAFATPHWVPVHYMVRNLSEPEIVALYRAADVMLVTPLRDGMNLVAKEFVAARTDGDGVLVLSEFAGASSELAEAIHVNPYDVDRTAELFYRALLMEEDERRSRMTALRRRVEQFDVHRWVASFLEHLDAAKVTAPSAADRFPAPPRQIPIDELRAVDHLILLLDYDGTLVPIAATPDLARPDPELLALLSALAARPGTEVHIVSGRKRDTLAHWLGSLPVGLHAEHGFWSRSGHNGEWLSAGEVASSWRAPVLEMLHDVTERTPGSLIEEKTAGLAWHYRMTDQEFGAFQANELRVHLAQLLSNEPVEILAGNKVVEIRPHGVNKGRIAAAVVGSANGAMILAIGDDQTDEDLFAALPPDAVSVRVGTGPTRARFYIEGVAEVRGLLRELVRRARRSQG